MPYIKGKGVSDLYLIRVARVGTKAEVHPETNDGRPRLVFELEYLESLPEDRKKVVFFDEMPWIDTPQSEFVDALEMFWNGWAARRNDIVFQTGSQQRSMRENALGCEFIRNGGLGEIKEVMFHFKLTVKGLFYKIFTL